ncbi:hypothetical protein BT96DRAFT_475009 [Gymnopus androsaceus JB14]|uniref:Uncharacterized protein n=1 Tax=Gymnopus androsaceus JB14 TaxID=1447944 RepID=A0A6A4GPN7_9AGAR|nr:hypothetical protein BT96DRAFT_475009 [Gymnopus androsaceus JB14]
MNTACSFAYCNATRVPLSLRLNCDYSLLVRPSHKNSINVFIDLKHLPASLPHLMIMQPYLHNRNYCPRLYWLTSLAAGFVLLAAMERYLSIGSIYR